MRQEDRPIVRMRSSDAEELDRWKALVVQFLSVWQTG